MTPKRRPDDAEADAILSGGSAEVIRFLVISTLGNGRVLAEIEQHCKYCGDNDLQAAANAEVDRRQCAEEAHSALQDKRIAKAAANIADAAGDVTARKVWVMWGVSIWIGSTVGTAIIAVTLSRVLG